jgi:hypothetical protein
MHDQFATHQPVPAQSETASSPWFSRPRRTAPRYDRRRMTEPLAVDQQLEEIGARLAWVRDYL